MLYTRLIKEFSNFHFPKLSDTLGSAFGCANRYPCVLGSGLCSGSQEPGDVTQQVPSGLQDVPGTQA